MGTIIDYRQPTIFHISKIEKNIVYVHRDLLKKKSKQLIIDQQVK
jgi:hypothetical protein